LVNGKTKCELTSKAITTDAVVMAVAGNTEHEKFEKEEQTNSSLLKVLDGDHHLYQSKVYDHADDGTSVTIKLRDVGEIQIGLTHEPGIINQPHPFRSPEDLFEMKYGPAADIWNFACLVRKLRPPNSEEVLITQAWYILQGNHLFGNELADDHGEHMAEKHAAAIFGLLGPPPKEFIMRSVRASLYFSPNGNGSHLLRVSEILS